MNGGGEGGGGDGQSGGEAKETREEKVARLEKEGWGQQNRMRRGRGGGPARALSALSMFFRIIPL